MVFSDGRNDSLVCLEMPMKRRLVRAFLLKADEGVERRPGSITPSCVAYTSAWVLEEDFFICLFTHLPVNTDLLNVSELRPSGSCS